ncbi:hypothetical protein HUE87_09760 [Candidatus Sulfurimonas marisnigri]|uniref:Uncharacterized protein n=1 Tax=Candidatus Sulfurimonas marisnigri TaxID=2740405 RepID=A0A7S7RQ01_9BACT|nr:hypothetical protein [Candidatus Sulfurimonas marisnigri]QOY54161.1 hypothetical protein HUE87_09760 [Candidatus Sulfurimonas marisnigri]
MLDDLLKNINKCNLIYFKKSDIVDETLYLYAGVGSDSLKIRDLVAISDVVSLELYDMIYYGDSIRITQNIA